MKYQSEILEKFPSQIEYVLTNYVRHNLQIRDFNHILLCGLGGSGIAGRIVKSYFSDICPIPIEVISDYQLPYYADETSLVILNSYSGNTEETLNMYISAIEKKSKVLIITTGGVLGELAFENNIQCYVPEKGYQPRMALGYSLTFLVLIFSELMNQNIFNNIKGFVNHFKNIQEHKQKAAEYFRAISPYSDSKFVIICDSSAMPLGIRFAQQLNENAKCEAFVHELPEMNHNVIESYYSRPDSVFFFINGSPNEKISDRFDFLTGLLNDLGCKVIHVPIEGFSMKEVYETIFVLDWLSLMVADVKNVRSDEIPNINKLKNYLTEKQSV